jgi:hypothetical protein
MKVEAFNRAALAVVGSAGLEVLRRYLVEGHTFQSYTGADAGKRRVAASAERFRFALRELTDGLHTAVGRRPARERHGPPGAVAVDGRGYRLARG